MKDVETAGSQISGDYDVPIESTDNETVVRTYPFFLPGDFWQDQDAAYVKHFIFEGVSEGQGKLVMSFYKGNQKIGESCPLYIDLKEVRKMYERGKIPIEARAVPEPSTDDHFQLPGWVPDPWYWPPEIDPNADAKTIVFVHGWRMAYDEYLSWSDTTFKRLWQLGYKGRFYSFRWPTYSGFDQGYFNPADLFKPGGVTYNPSEYRAWLSGPVFASFVNSLPNPGGRYLIAHSMGNVVAGAAFRSGMQVTGYAMCNAAMAAMAYDDSLKPDFPDFRTPDTDTDAGTRQSFGLSDKFAFSSQTEITNFSLAPDAALGQWSANNQYFKPQMSATGLYPFYLYYESNPPGEKLLYKQLFSDIRFVTALPEAMGYVTQSRTYAAGARQDTGLTKGIQLVNMGEGEGGFGFGNQHSAEWVYPIQRTYPFWKEVLKRFDNNVSGR